MLTDGDKQTIREIFREEVDRMECKMDKVLLIVTRSDKEHTLTKAKVDQHHKRITRIEKKLKIPVSTTSVVFA